MTHAPSAADGCSIRPAWARVGPGFGRRWRGFLLAALIVSAGCRDGEMAGRKPDLIFGERGMGPGQFLYPRALAIAPDGCVFIVDKTARIQRFSSDGRFEMSWRMPEYQAGKPTGITVDERGRVLVADTHYHRVMIYDRDGNELARFGSDGRDLGQLTYPTGVVVDREGNYFVSEYGGNDRITRFDPDFKPVLAFGGPDAGETSLSRPQSMILDEEQMLWVADACHHRICRFTRDGKLVSTFGKPGRARGQLQYPYDLAFCPDGTIVVSEYGNNRVQRFDREGKCLDVWGAAGRRPGEFACPWGVAVGLDRRVYVLDSGNNRVQVVKWN
ncbi:MAG TPA: hypothetical protein VLM89_01875 [Phycisphaerae bacterium]|nr:hypothetical protein [Phycisphaerae bacterium]